MSFYVVIPARLASTRLPNKPLADIGGKPMVVRVAEKAAFAGAKDIIVATDDQSIVDACEKHAVKAVLTRKDHVSGTDRIAEVSAKMNWSAADVVVNVQGDEPLIDPELISATAALVSENVPMATAAHRMEQPDRDLQSQFRQSRSGPVQQGAVLFTGRHSLVQGRLFKTGQNLSQYIQCLASYRSVCIPQRFPADILFSFHFPDRAD